jgi:hypothetical protein
MKAPNTSTWWSWCGIHRSRTIRPTCPVIQAAT